MTPEQWQQIEQIIPAWLATSETDRGQYLSTVCGEDFALRARVEELCAVAPQASSFMERPIVALRAVRPPAAVAERVGKYRLLGLLGSGGMGTVHRALSGGQLGEPQIVRQLAVKLLRDPELRPETVALFEQERRILATLDHPNIARLEDGGTTAEGRPFLAMEFVDGLPIHQHCEEGCTSSAQRIRIFLKVCAAVHYCHTQGVLHRDLKPTNILVTPSGEPKLIDFGIAQQQSDPSMPVAAEETPTPLTVDFASPEQVRNRPLGPSSDVYSLGVLLYLLLTGSLPYEPPASLLERLDQICDHPVRPPSDHASNSDEFRWLKDEVDSVVLRALEKRPEDRFASADELAGALRDCLYRRHRRAATA